MLAALFNAVCERFPIGEVVNGSESVLQRVLRDFHVEWPLLAAQTLNFCVVAYLLYQFAFKPLLVVIDERQKKITDGLQYADEMRRQLGLVEVSRNKALKEAAGEARDIIDAARKTAETLAEHEKEKLVREIEEAWARGQARIREERAMTLAALQKQGAQVAAELAKKILSTPACASGRKAFTRRACEEIRP